MKLYVIRHGQTNMNLEERYNCRIDEDINENGIIQAQEASKKIANLNIDLIICSPMKRTRHTAKIINSNNINIIYDDRLIERDGGILTGTSIYDSLDFWDCNSKNKYDGLETINELFKRVANFLDEIKEKYSDKNILIVTHGGVERAIYFYFNPLPKDGLIAKYITKNCEIKEYEL